MFDVDRQQLTGPVYKRRTYHRTTHNDSHDRQQSGSRGQVIGKYSIYEFTGWWAYFPATWPAYMHWEHRWRCGELDSPHTTAHSTTPLLTNGDGVLPLWRSAFPEHAPDFRADQFHSIVINAQWEGGLRDSLWGQNSEFLLFIFGNKPGK